MNKICFLILAHKNQNQLMRLINHLKKDFDIYIHIDKNSKLNLKSFDNVQVYKKNYVHYAEITQITTALFLIKEAVKNNYNRYCQGGCKSRYFLQNACLHDNLVC